MIGIVPRHNCTQTLLQLVAWKQLYTSTCSSERRSFPAVQPREQRITTTSMSLIPYMSLSRSSRSSRNSPPSQGAMPFRTGGTYKNRINCIFGNTTIVTNALKYFIRVPAPKTTYRKYYETPRVHPRSLTHTRYKRTR